MDPSRPWLPFATCARRAPAAPGAGDVRARARRAGRAQAFATCGLKIEFELQYYVDYT